MKDRLRIFLKTNQELRKFLWLQNGTDGSVYFGGSGKWSTKASTKGKVTAKKEYINGTKVNPDSGEPLSKAELLDKQSFHSSGIVNLPTHSNGRRERFQIRELSEWPEVLPMAGIIPMVPTYYPKTTKQIKKTDVVVNCALNEGRCFGLVVFIAYSYPSRKLLASLSRGGLKMHFSYSTLGERRIGVMVYYREDFMGWPKKQFSVTATPDERGFLPWPILTPSVA